MSQEMMVISSLFFCLLVLASLGSSAKAARALGLSSWEGVVVLVGMLMAGQIIIVAQLMSLFHLLAPVPFFWAHLTLSVLTMLFCTRKPRVGPHHPTLSLKRWINRSLQGFREAGLENQVLVLGFWASAVVLFFMLATLHPTTVDTYHLEMPYHWIQNKSLFPFPAGNARLVAFNFLQEAMTLPLFLYLQTARFAFAPEWFAFLFLPFLIRRMGVLLGFSPKASLFAGCMASGYSIIIQACWHGKNDLLSAVFVLASFLFLLEARNARAIGGRGYSLLAVSAFAFVMAWGVKNTTLIIGPAYLFAMIFLFGKSMVRSRAAVFLLIGLIMGLGASGVLWKAISNQLWFGSMAGPPALVQSHSGKRSLQAIWTRNMRGIYYLADTTYLPPALQDCLRRSGNGFLSLMGAGQPVPGEKGYFTYDPSDTPLGNGLGPAGLVAFIPALAFGFLSPLIKW